MDQKKLYEKAVELLKELIKTKSYSGEESNTASILEYWLSQRNIPSKRKMNNIWECNKYFDISKPSILLNSHHDTVKPDKAYSRCPFDPSVENGALFGLGSNDAGGCLVSLLALFTYFYDKPQLKYNLIIAVTAEEESSGPNGLNSLLPFLPEIDFAVVGEPTQMNMAVAEKGLLVIDGISHGKTGHAAHNNNINPIYKLITDLQWIQNYKFSKTSDLLGDVKMTLTQISAGKQHNVVPEKCEFVLDVRVTEKYTNKEVFDIIDQHTESELRARSFNLNSSSIPLNHEIVQSGIKLGLKTYGSPTLSDQSVLSCHSVKIGPGDSLRSHTADEFIYLKEIEDGIDLYIKLFKEILLNH